MPNRPSYQSGDRMPALDMSGDQGNNRQEIGDGRAAWPSINAAEARSGTGSPLVTNSMPIDRVDLSPIALAPSMPRQRETVTALPRPLTPLVGRERERTGIQSLLDRENVRLITLVGPGGVGKTRLALEVARSGGDRFPDGVHFIGLAAIAEPELVLSVVAQALGLREAGGRAAPDLLVDALHDRTSLLLLDNLEQVAAAGPAIAELLRKCPDVKVLATSRLPLNVTGEHTYPVPPLALPSRQTANRPSSLAALAASEAVTYFVERARSVKPDFELVEANAAAVAEICRRLDGLPLALELAASRTKVLSPQALLARLTHRLEVLTGGARDLPPRLQTMRNAVAWSYDLLSHGEQTLFRRLAVFTGSFTLDAAEAVAWAGEEALRHEGGDDEIAPPSPQSLQPASSVLDNLAGLVDHSLVQQMETDEVETETGLRFVMLETIRDYALDRLSAVDDEVAVRRRHVSYFSQLAEEADAAIRRGAGQAAWLAVLDGDFDNLRTALAWSLDDDPPSALRLAAALWRFWETRGHLREGCSWLERTLAKAESSPIELRAKALNNLGNLRSDLGDSQGAEEVYIESLGVRREIGDHRGIADTLNNLGLICTDRVDYAEAKVLLEESLALRRQLDDRPGYGIAVNNLGDLAIAEGDFVRAESLHEESLAVRRELGDKRGVAYSHNNLGVVATLRGDLPRGKALLDESLRQFRVLGDRAGVGYALRNLAEIARRSGERGRAITHFAESLALRSELDDRRGIAECLEGLVAAGSGPDEHRANLVGAAARLREACGIPIPVSERLDYERTVADLRVRLSPPAFDNAVTLGRSLSIEEACTAALDFASAIDLSEASSGAGIESKRYPAGLSEREVEVLRLLAQGLTNAEIADRLFLSPRTINAHLHRIYRKLDVSSRTAAARFAHANDLL